MFKYFLLILFSGSIFQLHAQINLKKFKKSKSGIYYRYNTKVKGKNARPGDVISLHLSLYTDSDSLIFSTYSLHSGPIEYHAKLPEYNGDIMEGFLMMSAGDSTTFYIPVDSMYRDYRPQFVEGVQLMRYNVKVEQVRTIEEFDADTEAEKQVSLKRDFAILDSYFAKNDISGIKKYDGIHIQWHKKGDGTVPVNGLEAVVHYYGRLLNGNQFDSSFDRNEPFQFTLGKNQVIQGWELAVKNMNKGDSATIYIPAVLAYGKRGAGEVIPPDAILIFDMLILDVYNTQIRFDEDINTIENYLTSHALKAVPDTSGVFYSLQKEGEGEYPEAGKKITVHYTGKLLGGQIFSSSTNEGVPFAFNLGNGELTKGLDLGITKFRKGARGKIYIPSKLGYGEKGHDNIPPHSILIFEVEILDIQ